MHWGTQFSLGFPLQLLSFPGAHVSAEAGGVLHKPQVPSPPQVSVPWAQGPTNPSSEHCRVVFGTQAPQTPVMQAAFGAVQVVTKVMLVRSESH
jgi:hypothetical protein